MISILPEQKQNHLNQSGTLLRLMKQLYGIDMEQNQYSKTIDKTPTPDFAISMGVMSVVPISVERLMIIGDFPIRRAKVMKCFIQVIENISKIKDLKLEK